jgi:hypothetical protein
VKELPGDASQLYLNNRFCMYDEIDNTIKYYSDITVDVTDGHTFNRSMNYSLAQNYPNPFNPSTSISYSIPKDGYVTLRVFDALGSEIELLENSYKSAGNYSYSFDASKLASGIYFYNVISGNFTETKKMLLMK